ncbi:ATP-binding protein [Streptomyces sp. NPDC003717]|uniref:ATP-binding protein n=1 Tax=Streptomyces sp. NPDC003717 TaxID=3154276 RepID=UPI0033AD3571
MEPTDGIITAASETAAPPAAPGRVHSAAAARAHTESVVRDSWDGPGRRARDEDVVDLLLVVSELVTNAIRHGEGLAGFEARAVPEGIRIEVHDHSEVLPRSGAAFPTRHHGSGYGWPLVVRLAREVAVGLRPGGGKTISALVPLRAAEAG